MATSRPPPERANSLTTPHSAQRVMPYEAFSTLQPVMIRPSSTSAAAPTLNFEYGAYAFLATAKAVLLSNAQSIGLVMM